MKAIKLFLFMSILFASSCSNTDDSKLFSSNGEQFIRFFLLANSNNEPLEFPEVDNRIVAISTFEKSNIRTLKIPVAISALNIASNTTATFTTNVIGGIDLEITPQETLNFSTNKLVDTIYVKTKSRWDVTQAQQLKLKLTSVSNPKISIGIQNNLEPNNELTINFKEPSLFYTFETNKIEINGTQGEEVLFKVNFPLGYFTDEVDENLIFSFLNGFDYTISKTNQDETSISFKITLNEDIQNDDVFYQTTVSLVDTDTYTANGTTKLQIVKPIKTDRKLSVNTAANFYNLDDAFHRTYGEHWNDFNNDGICAWQFFFAFSYPIVVDADNPNAILYDDLGNTDPTDDIYHHAFKIGFRSTRATTTTNSFNLRRWFNGESTSSAISPGFNVSPALEFFPENGTSTTKGTVIVESQFITIGTNGGSSYNIAISGNGTYEEVSSGLFEIKLTFKANSNALFGGTVTSEYRLYNNNSYTEPEPLLDNTCITETDL